MATAIFGAGCFWGVESSFRELEIIETTVGYMGGTLDNPTYQDVCRKDTGHVEVVQVEFDPAVTSYQSLLDKFWSCHNPTRRDRQGWGRATQYRSVIFYSDPAQQEAAEASRNTLNESGRWPAPIATVIEPASTFWRGEEHHQRYLEKHGRAHCRI